MSTPPILYAGDTALTSAAGYLAGLMTSFGWKYSYVPSDQPLDERQVSGRRLIILSDYPAKLLPLAAQKRVLSEVEAGAGVVMIGGWESYCGFGGDWAGTPVGDALPVAIAGSDDRVNCDQPALAVRAARHPIVDELPWDERPPTIGGFNRVTAKRGATTLLEIQRFAASREGDAVRFTPRDRHPLLVVGAVGKGRAAALTTDLAPHWVGGFVDWGDRRVTATAPGSWGIEVGDRYAAFVRQLLDWALG